MSSDYSQRIEEARAVSVLSVLEAHGFDYGKAEGESIHFDRKNSKWRINVTGQRWFDHKAQKGGYGSIDLIIHIANYTFKEAVEYLTGSYMARHIAAQDQAPKTHKRPSMSFEEQLDRYADETTHRWGEARDYLIGTRKLSSELIDRLYADSWIYANQFGSAVFKHLDFQGNLKGVTVRPSRDSKRFHMALGSKHEGFFRCGELDPDTFAIAESPIDAISYYQITGATAYASGGTFIPQKLLEYAIENKSHIILAFDNDKEAQNPIERVSQMLRDHGIRFDRRASFSKDWNQDIKKFSNS